MTQPEQQLVWRGQHKGLAYKIVHWGQGQEYTPGNDGTWNYYIFLQERQLKDFSANWLEDKVVKILPESVGFISHDYSSIPVANVDFHGGITYYAKHGYTEGYRCIEVGCDYNHFWDNERGYGFTLSEILLDVERTIDELQPFLVEGVEE